MKNFIFLLAAVCFAGCTSHPNTVYQAKITHGDSVTEIAIDTAQLISEYDTTMGIKNFEPINSVAGIDKMDIAAYMQAQFEYWKRRMQYEKDHTTDYNAWDFDVYKIDGNGNNIVLSDKIPMPIRVEANENAHKRFLKEHPDFYGPVDPGSRSDSLVTH